MNALNGEFQTPVADLFTDLNSTGEVLTTQENDSTSNGNEFQGIYTNRSQTNRNDLETPVLTFPELMARVPVEIPWLIQGLIPAQGATIVSGAPGQFKTWLLLCLALSAATGDKWLGHFPVRRCPILYLDAENGPIPVKSRLSMLTAGVGAKIEELGDFHYWPTYGNLDFGNPKTLKPLQRELKRIQPGLVILDSMIRFIRGNENTSQDMSMAFQCVKRLIMEFNNCWIFADHQRKPGQFDSGANNQLRGSSEKLAFVDAHIAVKTKGKSIRVEHCKSRFSSAIEPFEVQVVTQREGQMQFAYKGNVKGTMESDASERAEVFLENLLNSETFIDRQEVIRRASRAGLNAAMIGSMLRDWTANGRIGRQEVANSRGRGKKIHQYRLNREWNSIDRQSV